MNKIIENKQITLHITFSGTRYPLELIEPHNSEFIRLFHYYLNLNKWTSYTLINKTKLSTYHFRSFRIYVLSKHSMQLPAAIFISSELNRPPMQYKQVWIRLKTDQPWKLLKCPLNKGIKEWQLQFRKFLCTLKCICILFFQLLIVHCNSLTPSSHFYAHSSHTCKHNPRNFIPWQPQHKK